MAVGFMIALIRGGAGQGNLIAGHVRMRILETACGGSGAAR